MNFSANCDATPKNIVIETNLPFLTLTCDALVPLLDIAEQVCLLVFQLLDVVPELLVGTVDGLLLTLLSTDHPLQFQILFPHQVTCILTCNSQPVRLWIWL